MKEIKQDHRKFKRFDAYVTVHLYERSAENQREISGLSGDLSRDGLKIFTDETILVGTLLDLIIEIPDDPKPIKASGEVIWCHKNYDNTSAYILGIHFLNLNAVDRFRVLDYAYNNWLEDKVEEIGTDDPELGFPRRN